MTRETKVGLLVGLAIILLIGIIVSDHLSVAQHQQAANLTQFAQQAQQSVAPAAPPSATTNPVSAVTPAAGYPNPQQASPSNPARPLPLPADAVQPTDQNRNPNGIPRPYDTQSYLMAGDVRPSVLTLSHTDTAEAAVVQQASWATTPSVAPQTSPRNVGAAQPAVHYVDAGETLWQIAQKYYGDGHHWRVIADANPKAIQSNGNVRGGVRLVIPNKANLVGVVVEDADMPNSRRDPRTTDQPTAATTGQTIRVRAGDSLHALAELHLGSASRWRAIYDANRDSLKRPEQLRTGMKLRLPTGATASENAATPKASSAGPSRTYKVQAKDTLSTIAAKMLGNADRWEEIYAANRKRIDDPDSLDVGQELKIPPR